MIHVEVLADSVYEGVRLTTLELEYPRILLPELNTHRVFSRSTQSNRAVSAKRLRRLVREYNYYPMFTQEQRGMQGFPGAPTGAKLLWRVAREAALLFHWAGEKLGVHKQSVNRLLEPFQSCRTVLTSTDWGNFLDQRMSSKAQPEMQLLAASIAKALASSEPRTLAKGEWHKPYDTGGSTPEECSARCARVSYLSPFSKQDMDLAQRLVTDKHWGPFEHVAQAGAPGHRNFAPGWGQLRAQVGG